MPPTPNGRKLRVVLFILLPVLAWTHPQIANPVVSPQPDNAKGPGVSRDELARLRPTLMPDLRKLVERVYNQDHPSAADLQGEFLRCQFTPLRLGKLGPAIFVEDDGLGGPMAPMLNVYIPDHGSYRKIIEGAGFAEVPTMISRGPADPAPDLVYGGGTGVCSAKYYRYRYADGKYKTDACNQEYSVESNGSCQIKKCTGKGDPQQTFENNSAKQTYSTGPTLTAEQILSAKR